ncbi:MAG: gamma-glutamyl-gamma-aminobutyrate hydrolase family protein [Ignavibacteria bacterium]
MDKKTGISRCDRKFEFYLSWLESEGIEYEILDYHLNNFDKLKDCSSLVLTGGKDINPEITGTGEKYSDKSKYVPERDKFEMKLLDYAFENKIPVLGICRGMQLINCKLKGTLIADLESKGKLNHKKYDDTRDRVHSVNISEGTLLQEIINEKSGEVNSSHHQGIDKLGESLTTAALSEDGVIEGIEWKDKNDKPFLIGIQWHPERMVNKESNFSKKILKRFKRETENS